MLLSRIGKSIYRRSLVASSSACSRSLSTMRDDDDGVAKLAEGGERIMERNTTPKRFLDRREQLRVFRKFEDAAFDFPWTNERAILDVDTAMNLDEERFYRKFRKSISRRGLALDSTEDKDDLTTEKPTERKFRVENASLRWVRQAHKGGFEEGKSNEGGIKLDEYSGENLETDHTDSCGVDESVELLRDELKLSEDDIQSFLDSQVKKKGKKKGTTDAVSAEEWDPYHREFLNEKISGDEFYDAVDLEHANRQRGKLSRKFKPWETRRKRGVVIRKDINETDIATLSGLVTETGRIKPRHLTGLSAKQQRKVAKTIKKARWMGLMPYMFRLPPEFGMVSPLHDVAESKRMLAWSKKTDSSIG